MSWRRISSGTLQDIELPEGLAAAEGRRARAPRAPAARLGDGDQRSYGSSLLSANPSKSDFATVSYDRKIRRVKQIGSGLDGWCWPRWRPALYRKCGGPPCMRARLVCLATAAVRSADATQIFPRQMLSRHFPPPSLTRIRGARAQLLQYDRAAGPARCHRRRSGPRSSFPAAEKFEHGSGSGTSPVRRWAATAR